VQEEAPSLRVPVLVLRRATERREGIDAGGAVLVGTDEEFIVSKVLGLLDDEARLERMRLAHNPYGDGRACERIGGFLRSRLRSSAPAPVMV